MPNLPMSVLTVPTEIEGEVVPTSYEIKDATARAGAVELVKSTAGWTGKNRLRNNRNTVTTENTVVYTKNADDSVTIGTQTASGDSYYRFYIGDLNLPNGVYTVTKGVDNENIRLGIDKRDANEQYIGRYGTATYEKTITFEYNDAGTYYPEPWIEIENGKSLSAEVTVFPMICDAAIYNLSPSYEPHHDTVEAELAKKANTTDVSAIAAVIPSSATSSNKVATAEDVTASVDLLKDTTGWVGLNLIDTGKGIIRSIADIFTFNADKTVTANGTETSIDAQVEIPIDVIGDFLFSGCPQGGVAGTTYDVYIWDKTTNARAKKWDGVTQSDSDLGSGDIECKIPQGHECVMLLRVFKNYTVNNILFKPMLYKPAFKHPSYEPYHGSVEEVKADKTEVQTAISLLKDTTGWIGQNKIPFPYNLSDVSGSGITFTADNNGVVDIDGTTSGVMSLYLTRREGISGNKMLLPKGTWHVTGGKSDSAYLTVGCTENGAFKMLGNDRGNGFTFTLENDTYIQIAIDIYNATFSHEKISPMVCTKEQYDLSPAFEPFHESVEELMFDMWDVNADTGVHNLQELKIPDQTTTGTYTLNSDDSITCAGTLSARENYYVNDGGNGRRRAIPLFWYGKKLRISGGITQDFGKFEYGVHFYDGSNQRVINADVENGKDYIEITLPSNSTAVTYDAYYVFNRDGASSFLLDGKVLKPMIILADDKSTVFGSYAMTNRQLTEKVQEINSSVSLLDSPAEVGNTGMISIPISDIMQYSDIVVIGYNESDAGGNRFVAVIPTEIDGQFDVGIPFVVKSSTGVGFIVARIASNVLSLTFLDNTNTNITTMYVKKIFGRKR